MRRIATISGGRTFAIDAGDELATVYERLGSQVGTREERREVTSAFAGGAAALLLVGGAMSLRWFGRLP
jgi:Ca-activated chloride channel family protein